MTVSPLDNTIITQIDKTITWQFDRAANLISVIYILNDFFNSSTASFWYNWLSDVVNIETANDFGLAIWGIYLNCPRPYLGSGSSTAIMSAANYRKILKARFILLGSKGTVDDYKVYTSSVYGDDAHIVNNGDMAITLVDDGLTGELAEFLPIDSAMAYCSGVKSSEQSNGPVIGFGADSGNGYIGDVQTSQTYTDNGQELNDDEDNYHSFVDVRITGTPGTVIPANTYFLYGSKILRCTQSYTIPAGGHITMRYVGTDSEKYIIPAFSPISILLNGTTTKVSSISISENWSAGHYDLTAVNFDNSECFSWR